MKIIKLFLFILLLISYLTVKSQFNCYDQGCSYLYFDTDYMENLELIDSANNIWQYGHTEKSIDHFGKVFITDTINSYPPNNVSAFKIACSFADLDVDKKNRWFTSVYTSMYMALDTDAEKDGCAIEISFDDTTWYILGDTSGLEYGDPYDAHGSILLPDNPSSLDTISCLNKKGFSGRAGVQKYEYAIRNYEVHNDSVSVYLKFTFCSDSIDNNKEGWMIDDLFISLMWLPEIGIDKTKNEKRFINIYPCPSKNRIRVVYDAMDISGLLYQIFDNTGKVLLNGFIQPGHIIDVSSLASGIYYLKIVGDDNDLRGRFVKQ